MNNKSIYWLILIAIMAAYLGHAIGRADREDYLQQQKIEQR